VKRKEFGPNQDQVDAVLARLQSVDYGEALVLASLGGDGRDRRAAREVMLTAARSSGRQKALRAAEEEVRLWVNRWYAGGPQISGYGRDISPAQAALDAAPAILDAVGAMVVGDLLPAEEVDTLTGPWSAVTAGGTDATAS
jgi:hypothetical protein